MTEPTATERQVKWFASVRASLERETGRSLAEWAAIARTCPATRHRARLEWLKAQHGLLQNRASLVLDEAFGSTMGWSDPASLEAALWVDPESRAIFDAVSAATLALPGTIQTARKAYGAWSRKVQFAALRPHKGGGAMLGLAVSADIDARLDAPKRESWSERLKSRLRLDHPDQVDASLVALLVLAWEGA